MWSSVSRLLQMNVSLMRGWAGAPGRSPQVWDRRPRSHTPGLCWGHSLHRQLPGSRSRCASCLLWLCFIICRMGRVTTAPSRAPVRISGFISGECFEQSRACQPWVWGTVKGPARPSSSFSFSVRVLEKISLEALLWIYDCNIAKELMRTYENQVKNVALSLSTMDIFTFIYNSAYDFREFINSWNPDQESPG